MRNIDQQIRLLERLDHVARYSRHDLRGGGGNGTLGNHDTGVEFVLVDMVGEGAHLLYADGGVGAEFDPDSADCWGG